MLDMVKQETDRIESRFLEPACGGNFLAELDKHEGKVRLWVYSANDLSSRMKELELRGAAFKLASGGGWTTGGKSAWWLSDYPDERNEEPKAGPAVTREQLDELESSDIEFHKAFGYGHIIDLDDSYIQVTFDSNDKNRSLLGSSCFLICSSRGYYRLDRIYV